jgi:anti-anti-sigma factor
MPQVTPARSFCAMRQDRHHEVRLHVSGEIDYGSVLTFERALLALDEAARQRPITLDLSTLEFIDVNGWRAVKTARRRAQRRGAELTVVMPTGPAARVFDLLGPAG